MYERFTDRARRAVALAQEEAHLMQRDLIGTEHVLLGLIHEGGGLAATALESIGISLQAAREQAREEGARVANRSSRSPKFSPLALQVIDRARQEATQLEQNFIGTEHLLLSLLRDEDGVAARVLEHLGKDLSEIRDTVLKLVSTGSEHDRESRRAPEEPETGENDDSEHHHRRLRRSLPILAIVAILGGGTVVARRRGFLIGRNLIVRCRPGPLIYDHLATWSLTQGDPAWLGQDPAMSGRKALVNCDAGAGIRSQ